MTRIPPSHFNFVNDIVGRFDEIYYPTVPSEKVTEQPSEADQKLVQGSSLLPKDLQVITYDYAPNISNWILSTGILRQGQKDLTTHNAIEESADHQLRRLGVVPKADLSATQQLVRYVFSAALLNARLRDRNRLISTLIQRSIREFLIIGCWRILYKIESILIRCGIFLVALSVLMIPVIVYVGVLMLGTTLLNLMVLTQLTAAIGTVLLIASAIALLIRSFTFLERRIRPKINRWDRSVRQFETRNQEKLIDKQTRRASEIWVNLLLGQGPNSSGVGK